MEVSKESKTNKILSNIFYYLFVVLILGFLGLSFFIDELGLFYDILFVALIVNSLVITFYLAIQMLRYNFKVNKKVQIGIFLIVIGFILILASLSKSITFTSELLSEILEYDFFVYWGIGSVLVGFFVELTLFDQWLWDNLIVKPAKFIYRILKSITIFFKNHWVNIVLYTLDLVAIGSILTTIYFNFALQFYWWYIIILSASGIYLIIHHAKRIWTVIKFIAVDIFFKAFRGIYSQVKKLFSSIWETIQNFFRLIRKHWKRILFEFLRLLGVAVGVVLIYFGYLLQEFYFFIWIGVGVIIISEIFSRKKVLIFFKNTFVAIGKFIKQAFLSLWKATKSFVRGLLNLLKTAFLNTWNFIKKYYIRILLEIGRLIPVAGGVYLIYFGVVEETYGYFVFIGVAVILIFEIILRKVVLCKLYEEIKALGRFFKELAIILWEIMKWLYSPFKYIGLKIYAGFRFLVRNWFKVILYLLDIAAIGSIATTIYFNYTLQFYWWYILILSASGIYLFIHHAKSIWKVIRYIAVDKIYKIIKEIYDLNRRIIDAIGRFIKKYWKTILKEITRILFVGGGIALIYFGDQLEPELIGTIMVWAGIIIIPVSALFSRIVVLRFIWRSIEQVFKTLWLTIKYSSIYIGTNFLRIILLLTMLFALAYGIALIASILEPLLNLFDFLPIFTANSYVTRLSVGGGLVIVAVGAFILLRRELKKLRTGQSKNWLADVKEVWDK